MYNVRNVFLSSILILLFFSIPLIFPLAHFRAWMMFVLQDRWLIYLMVAMLGILTFWRPVGKIPTHPPRDLTFIAIILAFVILLWFATYAVFDDYAYSRDEHMVLFDMEIFRSGRMALFLPPQWVGYAQALVPNFLLDVPGNALIVSAYMPGNAAMRAAFSIVADPALMNPLLVGTGGLALFVIAKQLFADDRAAVWVALLVYLLSAQILVNAMTPFAMTGHLAFNLLWLMCFLRGGKFGHASAMVIGFWAVGLHQVIFHPLFAFPFVLALALQRRLWCFFLYGLVYAATLLFWISYPQLVVSAAGIESIDGSTAGALPFLKDRVLPLILEQELRSLALMGYNAMRFFAWQHVLLLPLLIFAWPAVRRLDSIAAPLLGGILLTVGAMVILMPYQGHAWGYRYLHGVLGNIALLCAYGYRHWAEGDRAQADGAIVVSSAFTALIFVPLNIWLAREFVAPYARLSNLIEQQNSEMVIVDTDTAPFFSEGRVRNLPDFSNSPLVFSSRNITKYQINNLCEIGTISFIEINHLVLSGVIKSSKFDRKNFDYKKSDVTNRDCILPLKVIY